MKSYKIFLVGFMGSGKSHNGKKIAKALKIDFFDLDQIIEAEEGLSISNIFEQKGEAHFRNLERKYLKAFKNKHNFILSTGGGTACYFDNILWMNGQGETIFLDASLNLLTQRLVRKQAKRPLLKDLSEADLRLFIKEKLMVRLPFYSQANTRFYQRIGSGEVSDRIIKYL